MKNCFPASGGSLNMFAAWICAHASGTTEVMLSVQPFPSACGCPSGTGSCCEPTGAGIGFGVDGFAAGVGSGVDGFGGGVGSGVDGFGAGLPLPVGRSTTSQPTVLSLL